MIKKHWPLWARLVLAPVALLGLLITVPGIILLFFAKYEDEAVDLIEFWMGKPAD